MKMDKKLFYILGSVFIIASGFLYTLERFIAYFAWVGQMNAHTGSFPNNPDLPGLSSNIFIPTFLLIGIVLFVLGYRGKSNS
jgi:hypothetical protein